MGLATTRNRTILIATTGGTLHGAHSAADATHEEYDVEALAIVNNWRSSHSFPLNTFTVTLKSKASSIDTESIVVQRQKRLPSILYKLNRFPGYRLSQIQDIGGCRAVLHDVPTIKKLIEVYRKSDLRHELVKIDDYLEYPQKSGYRGIHLIYKYVSDRRSVYNGLRIEIQLRSPLQHAWATAVETVGTFIQQALKSSTGEEGWLRFFKLMGSVIAHQEDTAAVPDTPTEITVLINELRHYAELLDVVNRLRAYGDALKFFEDPVFSVGTKYYLLNLDPSQSEIRVDSYSKRELDRALDEYLALETSSSGTSGRDVVLVSADSVAALQKAYPNYFVDTRVFIGLVEDALAGQPLRPEQAALIPAT
jgi:hypothetical protein